MDTATGNNAKDVKLRKKKTNLALAMGVGLVAAAALIYVVVQNRAALAAGGTAAAKALGPIVSRVLPAIVLGAISMLAGPEGLILGVPVGALFGPTLISAIAGGSLDKTQSTAVAGRVFSAAEMV